MKNEKKVEKTKATLVRELEEKLNYYKNLNKHDFNIFPLDDLFLTFSFSNDMIAHDLYFFGIKK